MSHLFSIKPACFWLVVVFLFVFGGRLRPRYIFVPDFFCCSIRDNVVGLLLTFVLQVSTSMSANGGGGSGGMPMMVAAAVLAMRQQSKRRQRQQQDNNTTTNTTTNKTANTEGG
jgi:hypothetical protein